MWLALSFLSVANRRSQHRYQIVAAEAMEGLAKSLEKQYPDRFRFHKTRWGKFPDGTDDIEVHGSSCRVDRRGGMMQLARCRQLGSNAIAAPH